LAGVINIELDSTAAGGANIDENGPLASALFRHLSLYYNQTGRLGSFVENNNVHKPQQKNAPTDDR
jgi:hypothetical protein